MYMYMQIRLEKKYIASKNHLITQILLNIKSIPK